MSTVEKQRLWHRRSRSMIDLRHCLCNEDSNEDCSGLGDRIQEQTSPVFDIVLVSGLGTAAFASNCGKFIIIDEIYVPMPFGDQSNQATGLVSRPSH